MFFVGVHRRQWFTAGRFLVVVRVIESPAWHRYLSVDFVRCCLVATLPRPVPRLTNHAIDLLLVRLRRLLPWLPHELREVTATDCAQSTAVPVRSRRCSAPRIPVRIVVAPLAPTQLQPIQQ